MKYLKKIVIFSFVFLSCWLFQAGSVKAIEAPAIVNVDLMSPHSRWGRPIVVGLTPKNTDVFVYVDGKFSGVAKINESKTETNNFYYQPVLPIGSGEHVIYTVAQNKQTKVLSSYSVNKIVVVAPLAAPTVFKPNEDTRTGNNRPLISGLTKSGTRVLVYIDGVYNGKTEIANHESGIAGFVYKPFLNLSVGTHQYFAIAETANGTKGAQSRVVTFNIEKKFPAPTLLSFVGGNKAGLTGLAKNDSKIQIYLDKKLQGEFKVRNDKSGTANFYFTLRQPLTNGHHVVYAVAIDSRGKESIWSNTMNLKQTAVVVRKPVITQTAASETVVKNNQDKNVIEGVIKKEDKVNKEVVVEKKEDVPVVPSQKENEIKDESKKNVLSEILKATSTDTKASKTGIVDEQSNSQSKLKLNLVIFVLFLLALVSWIFWVNRELINEKKERENSPEDKK